MIISYQGALSVKIQFGDMVVAYNPPSKESKFKSSKFGADIVLVSANHSDFNGVDNASRGDKEPFIIRGPGEYEIAGVFIRGFISQTKYGGESLINTIYTMNLEGMNICFLGALTSSESIPTETVEALDDIDILFVPIGGNGVLSSAEAYSLAVKLEPKVIIPIYYGDDINPGALKTFLKEGGEEGIKPIDKLTIKKKDLEGKEGDIVILSAVIS